MKKPHITALQLLLAVALFAGAGLIVYKGVVHPFIFQTAEDRDFLNHRPKRAEVFAYFKHRPEEQLKPGERFQMTGWRPLPERPATHYACVFVRMNGNKIYIFFDAEDRVEEFVIATS